MAGRIYSLEENPEEFDLLTLRVESQKDISFGEHVLSKRPSRLIAITESIKDNSDAQIYEIFPDIIWLASRFK